MARIRNLEVLFNLEKRNFKSAADSAVAALHCLLLNDGLQLQCVGTGDVWPEDASSESPSEMLPRDWNGDQEVYSLRYVSNDRASRVLLKIAKADHMLLVNAVMNENAVATMSFPVSNHVADNYEEYSSAYKDLESLAESFRKDIMEILLAKPKVSTEKSQKKPRVQNPLMAPPSPPPRPTGGAMPGPIRDPSRGHFPQIGGSDLDPFGGMGGGGMLMDPSGFGMPSRPSLPQFGVGGPGGLPRGAVPPGARFDPFMPPIRPSRFNPDPDNFRPPDYDDFI